MAFQHEGKAFANKPDILVRAVTRSTRNALEELAGALRPLPVQEYDYHRSR
jgi:hypothetical protein